MTSPQPDMQPTGSQPEAGKADGTTTDYKTWRARGLGIYAIVMAILSVYLLTALWPPPTFPMEAITVLDTDARGLDSTSQSLVDSVVKYRAGPDPGLTGAALVRFRHDSARYDSAYQQLANRVRDRRGLADSLRVARVNQIMHQDDIPLFWGRITLSGISLDLRLILLAIVAGMLGAFVHTAQSFSDYMGNRTFITSWGWWYLLRPVIGGILGAVLYFAIRGALFPNAVSASAEVSPFGVAAIGALAGLCSKQATDKLNELFNVLFRVPTQDGDATRRNPVTGGSKPSAETKAPENPPTEPGTETKPVVPRPPEADIPDANPF